MMVVSISKKSNSRIIVALILAAFCAVAALFVLWPNTNKTTNVHHDKDAKKLDNQLIHSWNVHIGNSISFDEQLKVNGIILSHIFHMENEYLSQQHALLLHETSNNVQQSPILPDCVLFLDSSSKNNHSVSTIITNKNETSNMILYGLIYLYSNCHS